MKCQRVEDNAFHLYHLSDSVNSVQHPMNLEGIDHVAMGVRDIERSAKWYIDVLGFERLHDGMWDGRANFHWQRKYWDRLVSRQPGTENVSAT